MKYFTFQEFEYSETAIVKHIDNTIPVEVRPRIKELVENVLDPLRAAYGKPIKITSGYRSRALNKAVGGSTTSAHSIGYAADLIPVKGNIEEFKKFVETFLKISSIKFDQYINEYSGKSSWVHIGYKNNKGKQRRQFLLYKNGKYTTIK